MSLSFQRLATVAFSTKRQQPVVDSKRLGPQPYLTDPALRCTPLDPADPGGKGEFVARLITEATTQLLETMVDGELDIRAGDVLVARGREYPIKACGEWEWRGSIFRYLIVEDLKR